MRMRFFLYKPYSGPPMLVVKRKKIDYFRQIVTKSIAKMFTQC